jgi:putative transport protein
VEPGDHLVLIGGREAVAEAVEWLGARADEHLAHDRRQVDYRRVLLSNADLAGRTVAELDLPGRFGGVVTRVRRGDLDLLARDDLHVLLGDRLRVVVPRGRVPEVTRFLDDTERRVSEVDAVSLGLSPARSGGLIAGFVGNPSLLAFATGRAADERVNEGYATLFALDTILQVLLVQVIVGLGG